MINRIHQHPIRVYVADTDSTGVVYHGNYLKYLGQGRVEYFRDIGIDFGSLLKNGEFTFTIRDVALNFHKPARLDDKLIVLTEIKQVRGASLRYNQRIVLEANHEEVICSANLSVAFVSSDIKPVPIPKWLRQEIEK